MVPTQAASASPERSLGEAPSLIQVRDSGRGTENGSFGGRKKKADSGNNLKVKLTGFPDQFGIDCESTSE